MTSPNPTHPNPPVSRKVLGTLEAKSLRALGETVYNTNGRAYLLQSAQETLGAPRHETKPVLSDAFIDSIPISLMFEVMQTRLRPELSIDVHESAIFSIGGERYVVTVRRGVAEVTEGAPIYGTPEPIGTFIAEKNTFRRIMLQLKSPAKAIMNGDVKIEGDQLRFLQFVQRFERGA
jgi:alkyl sulfatase BDS1-like metallo-beta-lactamase superfamily hydrolase